MTPSILLLAIFAYLILLFGLARWGDRQQFANNSVARHPIVYALALGVYCTSWTFYGLVGTASEKGWSFLPILLGPLLLFTLGYPILERIRQVCRQEHIHSIADFIASRYGKRQGVAATVSLVVLLATIPYIALQLKAVSDTLLLTLGDDFLASQDLTFIIAVSMIAFALLFGAKRLDVSGYHSGLMSAVAFESVVKLVVLVIIAAFTVSWLKAENANTLLETAIQAERTANEVLLSPPSWLRFFVETLLSMCAIFCLPRMFHVTFVECLSAKHLKQSRWLFSAYLIIISMCVFMIAWAGNVLFYGDGSVNGDSYVIALPLLKESPSLALLAFLGGFSAATAMVIVATITLSQMLSNDVILPLLVRRRKNKKKTSEYSRSLIIARRLTVLLVVMGAYLYQSILAENAALTSIGLIAFALVVQLAPAILFGLFWRKGNARGLYAGLIVGLSLWFYTLMIPLLAQAGIVSTVWLEHGLSGLSWLRPENLFGLTFGDNFTRGVILSLGANTLCYWWYSLAAIENFADRVQASAFTNMQKANYALYDDISMADLHALLDEFLGANVTSTVFAEYQHDGKEQTRRTVVEKAQRALAGTVGVASAQAMIESLRSGKKMAVEEVVNLFGETTKALRFNQEVLFSSFENISSGISIVDKELKMVAWNNRYETMFDYPDDLLKIGLHVADIMRFNGKRGLLGEGNVDDHIRKRLSLMSAGKTYRVVRSHNDDTIIEIKGMPLPNGGYVTTYDDITEFIMAQRQLEDANQNLEQRVQERTQTIAEINHNLVEEIGRRSRIENELRQAKKLADDASASKTKFLALAGHDIMQPLNAASLYASALAESDLSGDKKPNPALVSQLKRAIENTESIISSLLEISKVDNGAISPKLMQFSLDDLLSNLISEAMVQRPRSLDIRYCATSVNVLSDKHYLRRILQNLITNAVKYTQSGKVLVGCRRRLSEKGEPEVEVCILDNGPGISEQEQMTIFDEFYRSDRQQQNEYTPGIGLGLSVVKRFGDLLGHPISCHSELHRGSVFSIRVPVVDTEDYAVEPATVPTSSQDQLKGLKVLYVDDDPQNLLATSALLGHWHCSVEVLDNVRSAREYAQNNPPPAVLLMDYQLGDVEITGVDLATELVTCWRNQFEDALISVCIVSAANEEDLPSKVGSAGFEFLSKPIKPAKLRALLSKFSERAQRD